MTILAVDTALGSCSAAVAAGDGPCLARRFELRRKGHSEVLGHMVATVLAEADCPIADLDGLAATVGPGTFTGLRVGLSYVRGLALSTGLPLAGLTTLGAVAADAANAVESGHTRLLVALSTKRRDYYLQLFDPTGAVALSTPAALASEAVPAWLAEHGVAGPNIAVAGDAGASLTAAVPPLAEATQLTTPTGGRPDAATVARLAFLQGLPPAGSAPPGPLYLRAPDVTPPA